MNRIIGAFAGSCFAVLSLMLLPQWLGGIVSVTSWAITPSPAGCFSRSSAQIPFTDWWGPQICSDWRTITDEEMKDGARRVAKEPDWNRRGYMRCTDDGSAQIGNIDMEVGRKFHPHIDVDHLCHPTNN